MKLSFLTARSFNLTLLGVVLLVLGLTACAPKTAVHATNTPERIPEPANEAADTAVTETSPLNPAFPRLGMWWPDPEEQPLADIARYDWVILGPWDDPAYVASLKAIKPDIILLNATNACELSFNADFDIAENAVIREIPPEWFLTQVGSTLTADVDATTTTFSVADLTATDGSNVYDLFIPGDAVLIEGETVLVEAVDAVANTLTVRRGYVRPAAAHTAGTRLAAHITFWPNSWLLNLSTMSPTAAAPGSPGPERWGDYNARIGASLLTTADWDGLLIDRSDPDESWLIGNSTARTIDPDQSNALLTDYSAFDAAWNEGLRQYEADLRAAVGPDKIIFANWGMANYDLLNGNNFEGVPKDTPENWRGLVFGPFRNGSYFDWMAQSGQPNLTMIETYEDDGSPDPGGDGSYNNPCDDPGFTPNYRKMRFGLTTALLNDGFFSYEISTNGHGSLCLLWFDEYDNAGEGRGYLGQPLGAAVRAVPPLTTPDLLGNGRFASQTDLDAWDLWADTGYAASVSLDSGTAVEGAASARIEISQSQGTDWQLSFARSPVVINTGEDYTLTFWAKADHERPIGAWVQQNSAPWTTWLDFGAVTLTTEWQQFELGVPAAGSDAQADFIFGLGAATGTVWLDDVRLQAGSREVWRRDYSGGVALVNATGQPQTVSLDGEFRKIAGTQDPAVNDGSLVTEATLPPWDGLILLRQMEPQAYLPVTVTSR
jgi:hypothetical protein